MNNNKNNKSYLVAVYGSLRKGMSNSRILEGLDPLSTERINGYKMFSLGYFPGIVDGGPEDSILIEVYKVDENILLRLDNLESYDKETESNSFYIRRKTKTSLGDAYIYVYNSKNNIKTDYMKEGDWVSFMLKRTKK